MEGLFAVWGWMCCIYLYMYIIAPPLFPLPQGGGSLKRCHISPALQRSPRASLMAQGPAAAGAIAIGCTRAVDSVQNDGVILAYYPELPRNIELNATNIYFCCVRYFAAFLALGSDPPKLIENDVGPPLLAVRSSMYFFVQPRPCFSSIMDFTAFLPLQLGCVAR